MDASDTRGAGAAKPLGSPGQEKTSAPASYPHGSRGQGPHPGHRSPEAGHGPGQPGPSRPKKPPFFGIADVYVGLALFAVAFAHLVPFSAIDGLAPCHFFLLTGVPCPGCGFTRSFMRAAGLDFSGAFLVSPLGTMLFLGLVAFALVGAVRLLLRRPWPRIRLGTRGARVVGASVATLILSNWVYLLIRHFMVGDWG